MKLCAVVILGTLFVLANGMPPINREYNSHCRCLQLETRIIPPDSLRSIKILPEGPHCPHTEVMYVLCCLCAGEKDESSPAGHAGAGLSTGEKVCLDPQSSWVKKLVKFVLEKQMQAPLKTHA